MKKILIALTLGSLLCVPLARACDACCPTAPAKDGKTTLKVTGMTCDKCVAGVKKSLTKLNGVKTADVSLNKGQAAVTFDPAKVTTDKLIAAVGKAGGSSHTFKAELAEPRDTVTVKVAGMTCAGCAKNVEGALKKMEGVKTVQVDLDTGKAVVTGDPAKLKTDQLIAAVKQAGYKAQLATDKALANDSKKSALYKCESCGKTYDKPGDCCGAPTKKVN